MAAKTDLKTLSAEEFHRFIDSFGLPRYRAGQLIQWIYGKYATDIGAITVLSKHLRQELAAAAEIGSLTLAERLTSSDGTEKFLFSLEDGNTIESVLIPDEDRLTLCVSSQVGCAMGCRFCITGSIGLIRNLRAHEIADQVICVNRLIAPRRITNIVLMGMGEPLANLDEVADALRRIVDWIGISKRRITLSTAGIVPKLKELPEKAPDVNLAISLNATTDAVRNRIMPINRRYPLSELLEACRKYPLPARRRITFEYVLIEGLNDTDQDALRLVKLLHGIRCKVNLIPLNPQSESGLRSPSEGRILAFQELLVSRGMTALIRKSKGQDILAACGQLKAAYDKTEKRET